MDDADLGALIFISHPDLVFLPTCFVLATLSFSPQPAFLPIVLCLAVIKTYACIIIPRPHGFRRYCVLWITISLGVGLAHLIPSLDALSTKGTALAVLTSFSAITSFLALAAVFLDARLSSSNLSPWSEITLFPVIWAAVWYVYSHTSPIGRLAGWSPLHGAEGYKWLSRWAGPVALDWVVAGWAVLGYRAVGAWFIGAEPELGGIEDGQLIEHPAHENVQDQHPFPSRTNSFFTLAVILTVLALPSILSNNLPLPISSSDITPFTVACVLPIPGKQAPLSLDDFIAETKKLNSADVLLWPEGAVKFKSESERDTAFQEIGRALPGHHIGVGFEEPDPGSHNVQPRGRTGLALVRWSGSLNDTTEVKMMYYKRHLVPIAESFSLTPSYDPPTIYNIDLHAPKGIRKPDWAPQPNFTRPIPVTTSICLDFSHPSAFTSLESRPALILAPARTWQASIGVAMWEQAKSRAEEIGSMVLWCDGGRGGVSGIAGMGINEITRVGPGSFTRTIGISWPFDDRRTAYAIGGDTWVLLAFGFLTGGRWIVRKNTIVLPRLGIMITGITNGIGRAMQAIMGIVRPGRPQGEVQPLLS